MAVPFILADPDFETKELRRTVAPGESLRRLQVAFPARVVTHAPIQTFHFDRAGLLRRLDYRAPHADHVPMTQVYSGHQRFSGILIPCRSATQRCWMSKSSTSTLHRGALRCTRAAHRVREPSTSRRRYHRGAQVSQKRYNCSAEEYPSRDVTRFSALPCQHKPWCGQGRSQ
jgi:hypothetical protein